MAPADLDVTIEGPVSTETSVSFKTASDYLKLAVGTYTISVMEAGVDSVILATSSVEITNKRHTSVISGADAGNISILNLQDD